MAFTVTWLGQGGFLLAGGGTSIMIDPYLSNLVEKKEGLPRLIAPPIPPDKAKPDLLIATHDHIDHLDTDTISLMDTRGVAFAGPDSCLGALRQMGIADTQLRPFNRGDELSLGGFALRAVYASHTPDSIGVVVTFSGVTAYFTGDTLFDPQVGAGLACDVIFACINGRWGNMNDGEALEVAKRAGARTAIPHHYGMFAENTADPAAFLQGAAALGMKAYEMTPGKAFTL